MNRERRDNNRIETAKLSFYDDVSEENDDLVPLPETERRRVPDDCFSIITYQPLLHKLVLNGDIEKLEKELKVKRFQNTTYECVMTVETGQKLGTLLHLAIALNNNKMIQFLIQSGCFDLNSRDSVDATPIYIGVIDNNVFLSECLLKYRNRINCNLLYSHENERVTIIHLAVIRKKYQFLELLEKSRNAAPNIAVYFNRWQQMITPVQCAIKLSDCRALCKLLRSGCTLTSTEFNNIESNIIKSVIKTCLLSLGLKGPVFTEHEALRQHLRLLGN